jgi:predicted ribonuclease YlaK
MTERAVAVVDTNVLLHLAMPVVDGREKAPSGADPLKTVLTTYDVHVPASVLGEVTEASRGDDLLAAAAALVLRAARHLTTHDVEERTDEPLDYGLDRGESEGVWLANELAADLFVTDEFNTTKYLFVTLALDDRNTLFTTPHILCALATNDILPVAYVDAVLTYYVETKDWDRQYVGQLRKRYLVDE